MIPRGPIAYKSRFAWRDDLRKEPTVEKG
jgi:hypothetical protein